MTLLPPSPGSAVRGVGDVDGSITRARYFFGGSKVTFLFRSACTAGRSPGYQYLQVARLARAIDLGARVQDTLSALRGLHGLQGVQRRHAEAVREPVPLGAVRVDLGVDLGPPTARAPAHRASWARPLQAARRRAESSGGWQTPPVARRRARLWPTPRRWRGRSRWRPCRSRRTRRRRKRSRTVGSMKCSISSLMVSDGFRSAAHGFFGSTATGGDAHCCKLAPPSNSITRRVTFLMPRS